MSQTTQNTIDDVQLVEPSSLNEMETTNEENLDTDDDESDDESEDETENSGHMFPNLSLKGGTEKYVITADGEPQCYTHSIEEARKRMWNFARICRFKETQYNCYIREDASLNSIQVIGCHRFYTVSYDKTLCYLNVRKIQEIEETVPVEGQEKEENHRVGLIASIFG